MKTAVFSDVSTMLLIVAVIHKFALLLGKTTNFVWSSETDSQSLILLFPYELIQMLLLHAAYSLLCSNCYLSHKV